MKILTSLFLAVSLLGQYSPPSGGGGGGGITAAQVNLTGAYSALPAAGTAGRTYWPSDTSYWFRDNGATWDTLSQFGIITPPAVGSFTFVNQSSATADNTLGILSMIIPNNQSGLVSLVKSTPAAPYTITVGLRYTGGSTFGLTARDSASGKFVWMRLSPASGQAFNIFVDKWDSVSSENSAYINGVQFMPTGHDTVFFRIVDDATNRKWYISSDNQHFMQVSTAADTDFITANQVGFGAYNSDTTFGGSGTYNIQLEVIHYKQSTP